MSRRTPTREIAIAALSALTLAVTLAACGGPAASSVPSQAPATPAPTPTAETAVSAPASPVGEFGGPFAEALVAALASDELTTHIEQTANVTASSGGSTVDVTATMSGDVAGADLAFVIGITSAGVESSQELRVVGETAYVKQGDAWQSAPRSVVAGALDGLMANIRLVSSAESLRYVGPEALDGQDLHRLTAVGQIPYLPSTGGTGQYDALDVWIEADGTPVLIKGTFSAIDAAGNEGTGSTEVAFSQFGGPITIEAPPVEPSPGS
jgi:hypothetical protein